MTTYPAALDDDSSIIRIDDNLSELGTAAINQSREAIFAIEETLGVNPQGSKSSLGERVSISLNADGTLRTSAVEAVGLVTLPIDNHHIASNAGILESKLTLDYSTSDLNTLLTSLEVQVDNLSVIVNALSNDFLIHISGGDFLTNGVTLARHVASHIDINAVPTDSRDAYTWTGLLDKDGNVRTAGTVAEALLEINNELVGHENTTANAHPATAITVNTIAFKTIPTSTENVQEALNYIDDIENLSNGIDRAILHSNGIPRNARSQDLLVDGYGLNLIPTTKMSAYLAEPNQQRPRDSIVNGDDVIQFFPTNNSDFSFDAKFAQVKVGDIVRVNYGYGFEHTYPITSIRFEPGSEWVVRVNGYNLFNSNRADGYDGYARIDRARFDTNTWGVCAAAGVVPNTFPDLSSSDLLGSIIIGSPQGATAVGIGFDPNQIDVNHYNLYLRMYVDGNPDHGYVNLPAVDVSGNQGSTPGKYSIDRVVEETNKVFRQAGYNYRFISFNHKGEFGVMLADSYNGISFSIISGVISGASLIPGTFTKNVVGDAVDGYDALGLGADRSGFATPVLAAGDSYIDGIVAASYPTLVISPVRDRFSVVNGSKKSQLAKPSLGYGDGYWLATVTHVTTSIIDNTKTVEYTINLDLSAEELAVGNTIVAQPQLQTDLNYHIYGRFIIGDVAYVNICNPLGDGYSQTKITVINNVHGTGDALGTTPTIGSVVRLYYSDDSVGINALQLMGDVGSYHRYHEIFANDSGKTFAVERARMVKQSLSGVLLDTQSSGWRIRQVSRNFKGYRAAGSSDFRYFTRFVCTNYNSTTGEFDGYLSQANGNGTTNNGLIVRGKKDHPVRFYDNTNVNYIDIEFREESTSPGTLILPGDSISRYVDIEIFSGLRNHDEHFMIAGVSHDENQFRSVTDLREFGTLSEENFTDSAINFIQAGERYLHTNGIVRGFACQLTQPLEGSMITFDGGIALVNGAFVGVDSLTVKLPEVKTSISDTVTFFICVTETGQLRAIPKDIGQQFFERNTGYFVESLSFKDIVNTRKDLTLIASIDARIANETGDITYLLSSISDARRFVYNQDIAPFSWAYTNNEDGYAASFRTPTALSTWVNEYGVDEVEVLYVKVDSSFTLSFNKPVILKGGVYEVSSAVGIEFTTGNWRIKDASIFYYPIFTPTSVTNIFNTESDFGAIISKNTNISHFGIENCKFYSNSEQRPPFIGFYSDTIKVFNHGVFVGNSFEDNSSGYGLAYAFISSNASGSSQPIFANILISDTKINSYQGILVSGRGVSEDGTNNYLVVNHSTVDNFKIINNKFGLIGTFITGGKITISGNEVEIISDGLTATQHTTSGLYGLSTSVTYGISAEHYVYNNAAAYIKVETTAGINQNNSKICNNTVKRASLTFRDLLIPSPVNNAITIVSDSYDYSNVECSGNIIDGLTEGYYTSIYMEGGGVISGNTISNIGALGFGIFNTSFQPDQPLTIIGNSLHRDETTKIYAFINAPTTVNIIGNTFSHFLLSNDQMADGYDGDGYDGYDGYDGAGAYYFTHLNILSSNSDFATHNINQVGVQFLDINNSKIITNQTPQSAIALGAGMNDVVNVCQSSINYGLSLITNQNNALNWQYLSDEIPDTNIYDGRCGVIIPVDSLIPHGATLLYFYMNVSVIGDWVIKDTISPSMKNVYPQLCLEVNGVEIMATNIGGGSGETYTLFYRAPALFSGTKPTTKQYNNVVVRTKQGIAPGVDYTFGSWFGPRGSGSISFGRPYVKYVY
jgi:hypothetical protein